MTNNKIKALRYIISLESAKSRIRHLFTQERKVLSILYKKADLCNKEIAKTCFTKENSISVTLGNLESKNILSKSQDNEDKRKSLWKICDQEILDAITLNDRKLPKSVTFETSAEY
jgi:DNA-binding MarR family transcriptional regulator